MSLEKAKKIHRGASVGTQGEHSVKAQGALESCILDKTCLKTQESQRANWGLVAEQLLAQKTFIEIKVSGTTEAGARFCREEAFAKRGNHVTKEM